MAQAEQSPQFTESLSSLTRTYRFCAAHRLHTDELSDEVNKKIFGKCNNPNGHGHNYTIFVTIQGEMDDQTGLITDVDQLDDIVQSKVVERFDHQHLNFDRGFQDMTTTGENLAKLVWQILEKEIPGGRLAKIGVIETRDNFFEYIGDTGS